MYIRFLELLELIKKRLSKTDFNFSLIKGTKHYFNCECGKKIVVWTNKYGQGNTGKGTCQCGAEMYIN